MQIHRFGQGLCRLCCRAVDKLVHQRKCPLTNYLMDEKSIGELIATHLIGFPLSCVGVRFSCNGKQSINWVA
jgi:hypothetical protein